MVLGFVARQEVDLATWGRVKAWAQPLVASLAQHHPPDRCSFLLIDYKGAALSERVGR